MNPPICATCGQPGTRDLGVDDSWKCGNEACSEFGQPLDCNEPAPDPPASPLNADLDEH